MGKDVTIFLPKLGESIVMATVVRWFKEIGDTIELDEAILEVSTDKVNSEIPSPVRGVLKKIFFKEGEEVKVGEALAVISSESEGRSVEEKKCTEKVPLKREEKEFSKKFLSPVAKKLMEKHSISLEEIEKIKRTGIGGRLSKRDVEEYLKTRESKEEKSCAKDYEKIKMTPMRREIGRRMTLSSKNIPSASLIIDIDVTTLLEKISKRKESFLKENKVKLTITSFIAKAIAKAAVLYPYVNSSLEEDFIVLKRSVNLGIAIDVKEGLVVPVVKNIEKKSILEIAKEIFLLAKKARKGKLSIEDMQKGTITMSNFGMGGVNVGIPIIKYPEAAIIGIGALDRKVLPLNNSFEIRKVVSISLTFDHRIIDGMYGCSFLKEIKNYLEEFYVEESF
jgi:2-oxoglutarate dehydrogenase E2 component (dihydrolipoamide succinyltransferase)